MSNASVVTRLTTTKVTAQTLQKRKGMKYELKEMVPKELLYSLKRPTIHHSQTNPSTTMQMSSLMMMKRMLSELTWDSWQ